MPDFVIRRTQIATLTAPHLGPWLEKLEAHAERFFPEALRTLGRSGLQAELRVAVERANEHGLLTEQELTRFADLWLAMGRHFDRRPWAAAILVSDVEDRASALVDAALDRPDEARGITPPFARAR